MTSAAAWQRRATGDDKEDDDDGDGDGDGAMGSSATGYDDDDYDDVFSAKASSSMNCFEKGLQRNTAPPIKTFYLTSFQ